MELRSMFMALAECAHRHAAPARSTTSPRPLGYYSPMGTPSSLPHHHDQMSIRLSGVFRGPTVAGCREDVEQGGCYEEVAGEDNQETRFCQFCYWPDALLMVLPALSLPSRMAGVAYQGIFQIGLVFAMVINGIPIKSRFVDPTDGALSTLIPFLETLVDVDDIRPLITKFNNKEQ